MPQSKQYSKTARFTVENIGGITESSVEILPGVTVLAGDNATNRTSFLQSIMAAMGSDRATIKGDTESGRVTLEFGDETYERTLRQARNSVQFSGEPYLGDSSVADLFAFLLESNEARQAVARGENLRELIMRPVDIETLKTEIERLEVEKGDINDELATIESRKSDLPQLEQRRNDLRSSIEQKREEIADLETEIDDHSRGVEESRQEQQELEKRLDVLRSTRSDLESVRRKLKSQQESITFLKKERPDLKEALEDPPDTPMGDHAEIESEIERLRDRRQRLNAEISDLQSLIQYNEERLEADDFQIIDEVTDSADNDKITDQLVPDANEDVVCWTCGSTVERDQIEETVDSLQDLRSQKVSTLGDIKSQLEEAKADRRDAKEHQRRREELETEISDTEGEIERRQSQIETLKDQRAKLTDEVEALENQVDELESEDFDEILDLHKEANQLEFELKQLESDLDDVTEEIEEIEAMIESADDLRTERETLVEELTDKRTKIGQIEQEGVDQFNDHMDTILEILGYDNLDRIWIERVERTVKEGRRKVDRTAFDLHVVRSTESGTAYEDTIDHLSESEREVTGLVFALAGYLAHNLHETVPFMLLDSLEAIDADRIAALVDHFAEYADYLVVALLEEDAQALSDDYHYVTGI